METTRPAKSSLWSTARDYVGIVVLMPVVFGLGAAIPDFSAPKVYTSATRLSVSQGPAESVLGVAREEGRQRLSTELTIASSPETRSPVFATANGPIVFGASIDLETEILTLSVTGRTPEDALRAVTAYSKSYADRSAARQRAVFDEAAKALDREITLLRTAIARTADDDPERDRLQTRILAFEDNRDLVLTQGRSVAGGRIRVLLPPSLPSAPSNAPPYRKGLFGALLGSALSLGLLTVLDRRRASAVQPADLALSHPKLRLLGVPTRRSRRVDAAPFRFAAQVLASTEGLADGDVVGVVVLGRVPKPYAASQLLSDAITACGLRAIPVESAAVVPGGSEVGYSDRGLTFQPGLDDKKINQREALRRGVNELGGSVAVVVGPNMTRGSEDVQILQLADVVVVVIESGAVSNEDLRVATQQLESLGVEIAGALFV